MAWWTDIAVKHAPSPNQGGPMLEQRGVVLHIAEGTYQGTIAWQMNPDAQVSSHFIVAKSGEITQMVDTDKTAWTQSDGNGHWLSVENEGFTPDPLTDAQVAANARILAKAADVYGCPLQVCDTPSGRGLGHHSMGAESGADWGHSQCPGESIKAQKPQIVEDAMPAPTAQENASVLLATLLGRSGPTVGVALQSTYQMVAELSAALAELSARLREVAGAVGVDDVLIYDRINAVADTVAEIRAIAAEHYGDLP